VKVLLDAGADVHAWDDGALRWASENGHAEVVKLLIDAGADVHALNDYALRMASDRGHAEVVKLLKQHGAKLVNESIKHLTGRTEQELQPMMKNLSPQEKLETGAEQGLTWLVKDAIEEGVDIDYNRGLALRWACVLGNVEMVKMLIESGANIHIWDETALELACKYKNIETAKLLLDAGANVNIRAMEWAKKKQQSEMIKLLNKYKNKNEQ